MVNLHLKAFSHYNKATKSFMAVCRQNEFAVFLKDVQHDYLDNFMQLLKLQIQPITVILMIIWLKIMKLMMTVTVMVMMTMVIVMNLMMLMVIFVLVTMTTSTLVQPLCGQAMVLLTSSCRSFFGFILSDNNHIHISFFSQKWHNFVHR